MSEAICGEDLSSCIRDQFSAFAKLQPTFVDFTCPVDGQYPLSHVPMKRRVRPVANTGHESVLYRIEMNVVDMAFEIVFVANGVLPEPSLPKREVLI